jgi:hypothetical protein
MSRTSRPSHVVWAVPERGHANRIVFMLLAVVIAALVVVLISGGWFTQRRGR